MQRYTLSIAMCFSDEVSFLDQKFTVIDENYPIESPPPERVS